MLGVTEAEVDPAVEGLGAGLCLGEHAGAELDTGEMYVGGYQCRLRPVPTATSRTWPLAWAQAHRRPSPNSSRSATAMTRS